jgi:hypothetical protein
MRNPVRSTIAPPWLAPLLVLALGAALPASAHHSFAAVYDMEKVR